MVATAAVIVYAVLLTMVIGVSRGTATTMPGHTLPTLVLGHASPGGVASDWLMERLQSAARLYHQGHSQQFIVSGGIGSGDVIPVAQIMHDVLVELGVPSHLIWIEDQAANTYENFYYSRQQLQQYITLGNQWEQVRAFFIVTNGFHMARSEMTGFWQFEREAYRLYPIIADAQMDAGLVLAYLREPFSIVYNWIRYVIF